MRKGAAVGIQQRMEDPIRTEICLFDTASGAVEVVLETPLLLEAPNWHPSGSWLLVNGEGRLWRIDLGASGASVPQVIDTSPLCRMNNDHGFSPDGVRIACSDKTETGLACIYTFGPEGPPRRITAAVPAYFHGWSPDGGTLAFCARRAGAYVICTCPADGGPERTLLAGPGHSDGPDFTPDGRWIWFNASRGGSMDLWRIRPDGTALARMTDDARVNWFPHPAPDGRHVLYLSYSPGTEHHPRDVDVELRLMPAEGGAPRTLLRLLGGQGTINVPPWAPDGRRFAFSRFRPERRPSGADAPR